MIMSVAEIVKCDRDLTDACLNTKPGLKNYSTDTFSTSILAACRGDGDVVVMGQGHTDSTFS